MQRCFLQWYGLRHGTEYNNPGQRTEEFCPELKGKKNWDFVAIPRNSDDRQKLALEVKRVIRPHVRVQRSQWSGLLKQVNGKLKGSKREICDNYAC